MKNAIQAAVALLTKHPSWTHSAKKLHDESVSAADGLLSVAAHITRLESENRTHLARIALLESQLADETERLDFVLGKYAYCAEFGGDGYQLIVSDEEIDCIAISGEDVNHPTPRAAIDAAIRLAKGGK